MKQLLTILLLFPLFIACSSDDDDNTQDYTSFTVMHNANVELTNSIAGYKKDGKYYKISDLGNLKKGVPSSEIKLTDNSITEIYIFTDYAGTRMFKDPYVLKPYTKNNIIIPSDASGTPIADRSDPAQYPQ